MAMVTVKLFGTLRLDSGVKGVYSGGGSRRMHYDLYPAVLAEIQRRKPESSLTEKDQHRTWPPSTGGRRISARAADFARHAVFFFPAWQADKIKRQPVTRRMEASSSQRAVFMNAGEFRIQE